MVEKVFHRFGEEINTITDKKVMNGGGAGLAQTIGLPTSSSLTLTSSVTSSPLSSSPPLSTSSSTTIHVTNSEATAATSSSLGKLIDLYYVNGGGSLHLDKNGKIYSLNFSKAAANELKQFSTLIDQKYSIGPSEINVSNQIEKHGETVSNIASFKDSQQNHHHHHFHHHLNSQYDQQQLQDQPQPLNHLHFSDQPSVLSDKLKENNTNSAANLSDINTNDDIKNSSSSSLLKSPQLKSTAVLSSSTSNKCKFKNSLEKLETIIYQDEEIEPGNENLKTLNQDDVARHAATLPRSQGQTYKDTSTLRRNGEKIIKKRSRSFLSRLFANLTTFSMHSTNHQTNNNNTTNNTPNNDLEDQYEISFDSYKSLRLSREQSSLLSTAIKHYDNKSTNKLASPISSQDAVNMVTCNCTGTTHKDDGDDGNDNLRATNQPKLKPLTLSGIKNHGNTCFMNAILQCLSHTDLLVEYFNTTSYYYQDMKKRLEFNNSNITSTNNNICKNGSSSEVTAQCASLFQSLWRNDYSPDISSKFRSLIGKHCKQYEDGGQHDAQEFLFFLLDILHEDLNVAIKKKAKKFKIPSTCNRPDEVIAAETLSIYTRCDNSFIRKVFQAQLRSSVVCRSCKSHSNTFDPYMCLSLPVPAKLTQISIINVSYLDKVPEKIRMAVTIEAQATLKEMRHKVSRLIKVPENQLVLLINDGSNGIKELNQYKTPISEFLNDTDVIEAIETSKIDTTISPPANSNSSPKIGYQQQQPQPQQLTLVWTNSVGSSINKFFGPYFSCVINRDASFKDIQSELVQTMQPILKLDSVTSCIKDLPLFKLKVVGGIQGRCYLPEHGDHPLYSSTVTEALAHCKEKDYRGPIYVMLIVEWDVDLKQSLIVDNDKVLIITEDPNMEYVIARNRMSNQATLEDCFDMYFREEKLGADDAWMCPSCKKKQQCIKKLSLWSTPDILIIHLKRFRQATNLQRTKLSTLVNFPFTGLDLNPYLSKHKQQQNTGADENNRDSSNHRHSNNYNNYTNGVNYNSNEVNNLSYILYPWKKPREKEVLPHYSADNLYNLYAVCNHHGSMSSGHYTAYCRDINDHKWYSFDDQQVSKISESSIATGDAYILFYQRATIPPFSLIPPPGKTPTTTTQTKRVSSPSVSSIASSSTSLSSSSTSSFSPASSSSSSSASSDSDQSSISSSTSLSNTSLNSDNQSSPVKNTK